MQHSQTNRKSADRKLRGREVEREAGKVAKRPGEKKKTVAWVQKAIVN